MPIRAGYRSDQGATLLELLIVLALLGVLAGVVLVSLGNLTTFADESACVAEHGEILNALEAARIDNHRHEYPGLAGPDGLDAVRVAGYLRWGAESTHWKYAVPAADSITSANLIRINTGEVSTSDCPP